MLDACLTMSDEAFASLAATESHITLCQGSVLIASLANALY